MGRKSNEDRNVADVQAEHAIRTILKAVGEDPDREGLQETPARFLKAMKFYCSGYGQNPKDVLKTFEDGAAGYDEMVAITQIPFSSLCVSGTTLVDTPKGRFRIKDLVGTSPWVYTYNLQRQRFTIVKAENVRRTRKNAQVWKLTHDYGTLFATPDHRILTYDRGWVRLDGLKAEDRLIPLNRRLYGGDVHINPRPACSKNYKKWPREHIFVFNELLGRVPPVVHHDDGDHFNNDPENLMPLGSNSAHMGLHMALKTKAERIKIGKRANKGLNDLKLEDPERYAQIVAKRTKAIVEHYKTEAGDAARAKRSATLKAYYHTEEGRRNRIAKAATMKRWRSNHKVLKVEPWGTEDVYCMDVPSYENFVGDGIVVHNCEHHLAPFFGVAHIAYVPHKRIVGLSKASRLLDVFARRLQVQERLTVQVADALDKFLKPRGVAVVLEAEHLCMACRGVQKPGVITKTSALRGVLKSKPEARAEFFSLIAKS